jgi:flagellar hook-associated protein FlgK
MATVKLRKALQIKNRLAGEIANISKLIERNNSHVKGTSKFDVNKLIDERDRLVKNLIAIKTALAVANVAIYEKIAAMAEFKAEIQFYRALNTSEGTTEIGYGDRAKTVETVAVISAVEVEKRVKFLSLIIEKLQDEIDYFNSVTEVTIPD